MLQINFIQKETIFVFPTETQFALGCITSSDSAVQKIYEIKKRDTKKPLPILIDSWEMLKTYVSILTEENIRLLKKFWPGPLTAILPDKKLLSPYLNLNKNNIAVRMTPHPLALKIIKKIGEPIVGTSANLSGQDPIATLEEAKEIFTESVDIYFKSDVIPKGTASTIVDMTKRNKFKILRQGALPLNLFK